MATPGHDERTCASCGAALAPGQDWCLQCGAGVPGSLTSSAWRPVASVLAVVLVLVLGAAAAAYAALDKGSAKARVLTTTIAQATPPASTTPSTTATTPPATPGGAVTTPKASTVAPGLGTTAKPPKIPLTATTPKASEKPGTTGAGTGASEPKKTSTTPSSSSGAAEKAEEPSEEQQAALLLDTDAASTYDPNEYPAAWFGDPSLAIDGDTSTAWTAQVDPATAPKMAVGLLIDLKSKQKLSVLELVTSTPGMTVQVYGSQAATAPKSIAEPTWVRLSAPKLVKKKHLRLSLRDSKKGFRFVALWISKAPKSAIGTPEAPGHVDVNEVELFPTS